MSVWVREKEDLGHLIRSSLGFGNLRTKRDLPENEHFLSLPLSSGNMLLFYFSFHSLVLSGCATSLSSDLFPLSRVSQPQGS